jgi:phosphopantothenoylcysteine decarboxylase/phosphopantothenate--cysteine ligase
VLITAGPTQEPVDPVRFISNPSSGKMGYALAEAASQKGARVILVSGPVSLPPPRGQHIEIVKVRTAREMYDAVLSRMPEATIILKAAAVADYRVIDVARQKLKKSGDGMLLQLEPNPDILSDLGRIKGDRLLVGFAAETENLIEEARRKMNAKNCDMVVANFVGREGTGFESEDNEVVLVLRTGESIPLERMSKRQVADHILDQVVTLRRAVHATR